MGILIIKRGCVIWGIELKPEFGNFKISNSILHRRAASSHKGKIFH